MVKSVLYIITVKIIRSIQSSLSNGEAVAVKRKSALTQLINRVRRAKKNTNLVQIYGKTFK